LAVAVMLNTAIDIARQQKCDGNSKILE